MKRTHSHPCSSPGCRNRVLCSGELTRNDDGWPETVCSDYHLSSGVINAQPCETCIEKLETVDAE
jgi:hypothetical protein